MKKSILYKIFNYPPKEAVASLIKKILPDFHLTGFYRLINFPRHTPTAVKFFNKKISIIDVDSFLSNYHEIFKREIYRFTSDSPQPYIVDCGSNIGLSIIYFKRLYPNAEIVGFEPDPSIFKLLESNVRAFEFKKVNLIKKGLWSSDKNLSFLARKDDAGRIVENKTGPDFINIQTVSLKKYLDRPVDFLKIDIEGAEAEVVKDCRDMLINVKNIVLEYHSFTGEKQSISDILDILNKAGFRCYIKNAGAILEQPFFQDKQDGIKMDMQLNIYGCRSKI